MTIDGTTYPMPVPFLVIAHAEPDRVRGHVRAAGGAARPLHAAPAPRLSLSRSRRSSSSTSRSAATRSRRSTRSSASVEDLPDMQHGVREIYVDPPVATTSSGWSTPRAAIPTSTSAHRRAARSRSTAPDRPSRRCRPRLRHPGRHQAAGRARPGAPPDHQDVRLDPRRRPGRHRARAARQHSDRRAGAPPRSATASGPHSAIRNRSRSERSTMIRRLEFFIIAVILLVGASRPAPTSSSSWSTSGSWSSAAPTS